MTPMIQTILTLICIVLLPSLTLGIIRKTKAHMQGRLGAPIYQPLLDLWKLFRKQQKISDTTTWVFPLASSLNLAVMILIAALVPWLSFKQSCPGDDFFVLLYLAALPRFMTILSAIDSGGPFGSFGSSREAYLGMLTEPAMFISLASLGLLVHSSSLSVIFDLSHTCSIYSLPVWLAAGTGMFLAAMVDLSRMPIDDPMTHLELTMVHEAMVIENSGKNLALVEFTHSLKLVVLYGMTAQCLLHAATYAFPIDSMMAAVFSIALIFGLAVTTAMVESAAVKLQWRATPDFIAYGLTVSLFAAAAALIGGAFAGHNL